MGHSFLEKRKRNHGESRKNGICWQFMFGRDENEIEKVVGELLKLTG
jgi:hypothetical protein